MRFFSQIVLICSAVVVVIGCRATTSTANSPTGSRLSHPSTTTSIDGIVFRPKSRITTISSKVPSTFSAAVRDVPIENENDVMVQLLQRGGATASTVTTNGLPKALAGAIFFAMIEKIVKMTLQHLNIAYPAQLGACIVLFVVLCITDAMISPSLAATIYTFLTPGAALLAKWFPIFFIPGLVLLPLSPPIGGTADVRTYNTLSVAILSLYVVSLLDPLFLLSHV